MCPSGVDGVGSRRPIAGINLGPKEQTRWVRGVVPLEIILHDSGYGLEE